MADEGATPLDKKIKEKVIREGPKNHLKGEFLKTYAKNFSLSSTAFAVGVDRKTVFDWRESDPDFAQKFNAIDAQITDSLQARAITRALTDADPGSVTLLIFMLKARLPDVYREKIVHEVNLRFMNMLITDISLIIRKHVPIEVSNTIAKELEALSNRLVASE